MRSVCASLFALAAVGLVAQLRADDPATRKVLGSEQNTKKIAIVGPGGAVEWEYALPKRFAVHDISILPNGNILTHLNNTQVVEINPKKEIVWEYVAKPKEGSTLPVEVHAIQRLDDGKTLIAESGNARLVEVDKDGKITKTVPLGVIKPSSHRDTRMARKLPNGNYLVCHEGMGMVREYDGDGKTVWEYKLDLNGKPRSNGTNGHDGHGIEVFGAARLANGNTLIGGGNNNRVIEVNKEGKVVWSVEQDELPGVHLCWVTVPRVLPNGNIIIGNAHAGPNNPQLIEVTRDKKVVWTFKNFKTFGDNFVAFEVLGADGKPIR
jgi:hypothetical protein